MKKSQMFVLSFVCVVIATAMVAMPAHAVIIAADGFDYSAGQLAGSNGGIDLDGNNGWSGAWRDGTDFAMGARLPTMANTGGSRMGSDTGSAGGTIPGLLMGVERPVQENQATDTYYFGFDLKYFANTGSSVVASLWGMGMDVPGGGGGSDLVALAIVSDPANNGGTEWLMHGNIKSGGVSGPGRYAAGVDHRVVGRLHFNKGGGVNDELVLWVNPASEGDAPQVTHFSQDLAADMNGLVMGILGRDVYGNPSWQTDNVVLSTTFGAAASGGIPEPATFGLLSLGLICLGATRRRS